MRFGNWMQFPLTLELSYSYILSDVGQKSQQRRQNMRAALSLHSYVALESGPERLPTVDTQTSQGLDQDVKSRRRVGRNHILDRPLPKGRGVLSKRCLWPKCDLRFHL